MSYTRSNSFQPPSYASHLLEVDASGSNRARLAVELVRMIGERVAVVGGKKQKQKKNNQTPKVIRLRFLKPVFPALSDRRHVN